jgi:monoamine oxidase
LRCAEVLIETGIQVTILEARDRIGGRVSGSRYNTWQSTYRHV